jgi:fido (protein-threonine AMPylation protein)
VAWIKTHSLPNLRSASEIAMRCAFSDGNGRSAREFFGQIARGAGFFLDQTKIDNERGQWNMAAQRSMFGDPRALEEIISNAIRYSRAIAFEKMPESEARHQFLKKLDQGVVPTISPKLEAPSPTSRER